MEEMKKKLLFWISDDLLHYCLSHSLQKKYDMSLTEKDDVENILEILIIILSREIVLRCSKQIPTIIESTTGQLSPRHRRTMTLEDGEWTEDKTRVD